MELALRNKVAVIVIVAVFLLSIQIGLPSCKPAEERTITVGFWGDMTGPIADGYREPVYAAHDSYRWLNEKEGGIDGIKVRLLWFDTGYALPRAVTAYKRSVEGGAVVMSCHASHEAEAVRPMAEKDQIPVITAVASPRTLMASEWIFTIEQLPAADQFGGFAEWLKVGREPKPVKVALIGYDNEFGRAIIIAGKRYEKEGIVKVVAEEYFAPAALDYTTQVLRAKENGAEWVYITGSIPNTLGIMRDMGKLGFKVNVCSAPTTPPEEVLKIGGGLMEGLYTNLQTVLPDENIPGVNQAVKMFKEYRSGHPQTGYLFGWTKHRVIIEALKIALQEKGYDKLNGLAVRDAILKIKNLDMMGVMPPVSFSKEDPRGMKHIRMTQIKGGKVVPISDWIYVPFIKD